MTVEKADSLMKLGFQVNRERPEEGVRCFAEATAIYRGLAADGAEAHVRKAMWAASALGRQYSFVHADDLALAARQEAAELARRLPAANPKVLADLAGALAEAARYEDAVAVQSEVVDRYRSDTALLTWALLELAIYLELAGRTDESLATEHELLALPHGSDARPIWAAGSSLRFAGAGRPDQARRLLDESVTTGHRLPATSPPRNFGYLSAVQTALFARSGAADEPADALRPVHGLGIQHWSFRIRQAYREGLAAIDEAIRAESPDRLSGLGLLARRRAIRIAVLDGGPRQFLDEVIPALDHNAGLERRLFAQDPDPRRLIRALTDLGMGLLAIGANARAAEVLSEARDLRR